MYPWHWQGVKGTGVGEGGPAASPASAMLWPVGASLSPLDLFLLREFQGGGGEAHKWRWSREAAGSLGEVELEICCVTLDQST